MTSDQAIDTAAQDEQEDQQDQTVQRKTVPMVPVKSSNLKSVGYDAEARELYILFKNDKMYRYTDVPEAIADSLVSADSAGKFYHASIKGIYTSERVEAVPAVVGEAAGSSAEAEQEQVRRVRLASTEYRLQLTFQVLSPLLRSIPRAPLAEFIATREREVGKVPARLFLLMFARKIEEILVLINDFADALKGSDEQDSTAALDSAGQEDQQEAATG